MADRARSDLWKALRPITILAAVVLAAAIFIMDLRAPQEAANAAQTPATRAKTQ
jgi:negative regulator of sigma E activity